MVHRGNQLADWATTAAVMAEFGLVVTVDTRATHLATAWAEGRARTLEQAIAYALDEQPST